mmetsp:Transcript_33575/g.79474  ORF Transcript_33575/g.79474 Transcript_33575/m.79474 type:complete len:289 (+) Transcript_33575:112-978(+)
MQLATNLLGHNGFRIDRNFHGLLHLLAADEGHPAGDLELGVLDSCRGVGVVLPGPGREAAARIVLIGDGSNLLRTEPLALRVLRLPVEFLEESSLAQRLHLRILKHAVASVSSLGLALRALLVVHHAQRPVRLLRNIDGQRLRRLAALKRVGPEVRLTAALRERHGLVDGDAVDHDGGLGVEADDLVEVVLLVLLLLRRLLHLGTSRGRPLALLCLQVEVVLLAVLSHRRGPVIGKRHRRHPEYRHRRHNRHVAHGRQRAHERDCSADEADKRGASAPERGGRMRIAC